MKQLAQCLRTPSPFLCDSERPTSRQTIIGWEFRTWGKYTISFLIGSRLSQLTIFLWFGEMIGCSQLLGDRWDRCWYMEGERSGFSMRSTTASSISRSNFARVSASFCWPVLRASFSSRFMRTREDLEARDNLRMTKEMRIGNEIYTIYFWRGTGATQ